MEHSENIIGGAPIALEIHRKKEPKRERPWYPESIPIDMNLDVLSNAIIQARNWAIIALGFQIVATVAGFAFLVFRRVSVSLEPLTY